MRKSEFLMTKFGPMLRKYPQEVKLTRGRGGCRGTGGDSRSPPHFVDLCLDLYIFNYQWLSGPSADIGFHLSSSSLIDLSPGHVTLSTSVDGAN